MISTVSLSLVSGALNDWPWSPSTTLRTARPEAQDEAIIADRGHRQRGHRGHRGHPRADLHDAGAKPDTACSGGEIRERRNRVLTPCLSGPDRIYAEFFCFDDVFDLFVEVAPLARGRAADSDADFHLIPPGAGHCRDKANETKVTRI
jgi:hypothetical protein